MGRKHTGRWLNFPFHHPSRAPTELPQRVNLQKSQPRLTGKRVLIVADNPTNHRILHLQTQAWGMTPIFTASPFEALAWIEHGAQFDLGLLDMQMPEMDGAMLAQKIHATVATQALPLVMLTSLGLQEARPGSADFAAFLTKPIRALQLYDALVNIFAQAFADTLSAAPRSQFDELMGERLPLHILMVEDNPVNQKLALLMLERLGYRADVAGNGQEALEALAR